MTWNNRIIERELKASNGTTLLYGLHETYYNQAGLVTSYTSESVAGYYESVDELIATLEQQLADAKRCLAKRDIIVEKGFIFAAEDGEAEEALTPAEAERVSAAIQIEAEPQQFSGQHILAEIQKSDDIARAFTKVRDAERPAPVSREALNQAVDESNARMENMSREERIALGEYARTLQISADEARVRVSQMDPVQRQNLLYLAHVAVGNVVSAPASNKLFYAQYSRMDDNQIGAMNALAEAGRMCCLICDGSVIGWIDREKVHLLPNLNSLVLNQPRPLIGKCPKCQGVEWRYMGCYALDEFDAQNGFECMGCRSRQYDCFKYRKNPDQSADRVTGEAQDSEAESQLGSPS